MDCFVFDLGNTRAHFARWTDGRLRSPGPIDYDELFKLDLDAPVFYASVNTRVDARFDRRFRAKRMGRDFEPAIRNRAAGTGADRLANGVAAWNRVKGACVVVDVGTATTFDVVNARGEFVGGMIAPGPSLQARSLHEHTALLPRVTVRPAARAIGQSTSAAINAGVHFGLVGLVWEGLDRIERELGVRPRSLATGGGAALVRGCVDEVVDWLTLEGIARSASKII